MARCFTGSVSLVLLLSNASLGAVGPKIVAAKAAIGEGGPADTQAEFAPYAEPQAALQGRLRSAGSDTLNELMSSWAEEFGKHHPKVEFATDGKGSSTAIPGLLLGRSDLGPMSRIPNAAELERWLKTHRFPPVLLPVAADCIVLYVNRRNPVAKRGLTLAELDAIYSSTRKRGHQKPIVGWRQLGIEEEPFASLPIRTYGHHSASGAYGYFKLAVLEKGQFHGSVIGAPSAPNTMAPARDEGGISYGGGLGPSFNGLAAVPLAAERLERATVPNRANIVSGGYPLGRLLYISIPDPRDRKMPPPLREFVRFIYSSVGQELVVRSGLVSITPVLAKQSAASLGIAFPRPDEGKEPPK